MNLSDIARRLALALGVLLPLGPALAGEASPTSKGVYRLPYADGVQVQVFDDFDTHRPRGRIDFTAGPGARPVPVVAAAGGMVVAIQDSYAEQQSGRAARDCRNNYVWLAHPNGEWSTYSHLAQGSATGAAGLKVGQEVRAGQLLGHEAAVGCAMLDHVHFEVVEPSPAGIDAGGFLIDNEGGKRARKPRFCGVAGDFVRKGETYTAAPCP